MIKPVVLLTDAFFFVLIGLFVAYLFYARSRPHLRLIWVKFFRNRVAIIATIFLISYFVVALLDSLHFHEPLNRSDPQGKMVYSNEVVSVLDKLLWRLRTQSEKTYSAPFATHAYVKEISIEENITRQYYPPLIYGGSHLTHPEQKSADILASIAQGAGLGLFAFIIIYLAVCGWHAHRYKRPLLQVVSQLARGQTDLPWRVAFATLMFLMVIVAAVARLSLDYHVLGTDKIGEDVLYQAIKSIRTGVLIGTLTTLIMLPFALILGISAGYFLGKIDDLIQYLYTTLNSIPGVLLVAAAVLMLHLYMDQHAEEFNNLTKRSDLRLLFLCAILGITSWTGLCRLLRAETLKVKSMNYIEAAQVLAIPKMSVLMRHVLPNVMHIVFITIALDFSGLVLAETVLSYINIGVDPTMHSWGNMINSARLEMARDPVVWWPLIAAMIFLFGLVLCANLFADGVRDAFDPRSVEAKA